VVGNAAGNAVAKAALALPENSGYDPHLDLETMNNNSISIKLQNHSDAEVGNNITMISQKSAMSIV
jgi:hypothetical protein